MILSMLVWVLMVEWMDQSFSQKFWGHMCFTKWTINVIELKFIANYPKTIKDLNSYNLNAFFRTISLFRLLFLSREREREADREC